MSALASGLALVSLAATGVLACEAKATQPAPAAASTATPSGAPAASASPAAPAATGETAAPDVVEVPAVVAATGTAAGKAPASNGLKSGPASPEILKAARAIQKDLECLRGLKFKVDPDVAFQSLDDFRAYVDKQVKKELGGDKGKQMVRMLHALDVVDPSVDVISMLVEAAVGQAAAYYDPETNTFYVVQEMPPLMLNSVMAHELQHALQDQHTDLLDEYLDQGFGTTDQDLATRFVVEGEATLIGHSWLVTDTQTRLLGDNAGPKICHLKGARSGSPDQFWPMMRNVVAEAAKQTRDDVLNPGLLTRLAANSMMSEGMAESMEQLKSLPVYFFYTLLLPYNQGGMTVYSRFEEGNFDWSKVDALFAKPPESTEQVLHPEKLVTREPFAKPEVAELLPFDGDAAALAGWASDPVDRLGELTLRILLIEEGTAERAAITAATGWNGDAVRVWHKQDMLAFDWKIGWDSAEAMQGFVAYLPGLVAAQRGGEDPKGQGVQGLERLDAKAESAGLPFTWTDSQGRGRHGRISWSKCELRWTDGWPAAVKMSSERNQTRCKTPKAVKKPSQAPKAPSQPPGR